MTQIKENMYYKVEFMPQQKYWITSRETADPIEAKNAAKKVKDFWHCPVRVWQVTLIAEE